jgi:hypothetical protein
MRWAKVKVTTRGAVKVYARGFTFGDVLRVRLNLRISKSGLQVKHPPLLNQIVTFADETIDCPPSPDAFNVRPNGAVSGSTSLAACLAPYPTLAGGAKNNNIEVLGSSLVNVLNGKVLARSGVVR